LQDEGLGSQVVSSAFVNGETLVSPSAKVLLFLRSAGGNGAQIMDEELKKLQDRLKANNEESRELLQRAKTENRDPSEEERETLKELIEEFDQIKGDIETRNRVLEQEDLLSASEGDNRQTTPEPIDNLSHPEDDKTGTGNTRGRTVQEPRKREPARVRRVNGRDDFKHFGEFALAVRSASQQGGYMDNRLLVRAPTIVGSEGSGVDGGFAVPPDFRNEIMTKVMGKDTLLGMTDEMTSSGNSITVPIDEATPWQSTGGILAYWEGENTQTTQSKPQLQNVNVRLAKVTVLVPITEELLEDAPAMDGYLRRKAPEKINFKVDLAIVQGSGVGQPLGFLNSPCLKTVAKETSQTLDTINYDNLLKMWSGMLAEYRGDAVWLANQECEPQFHKLSFEGTSSSVPAWMPAGGISGAPYQTIWGKPIIYTQACETLGDLGDICFVNLKHYMSVTKSTGIRADTSMHLWFDYNTVAFRFTLRVGGQPWWASTVAARDGSATYSPFVALAERA
jgi:HK97 family phage major capsid protein